MWFTTASSSVGYNGIKPSQNFLGSARSENFYWEYIREDK
jgi:hypothetical protein